MRNLLLILLAIVAFDVSAQLKYEKEVRVKISEVPLNAVAMVDEMKLERKIRWYKEIGLNRSSYEAKTRHDGRRVSIEFSEDGAFEDLEIEINKKEIEPPSLNAMMQYLDTAHSTYRMKKIQVQYSGGPSPVLRFFIDNVRDEELVVRYELVVAAKRDGSFVMYEYLFSEEGVFIQRARIMLNLTDNIEY